MALSFLLLCKFVIYRTEAILISAKTIKSDLTFFVKGMILKSFKLTVSLHCVSQKIQPKRMNDKFGVEVSFLKNHSQTENRTFKFRHKGVNKPKKEG